MMMTTTVSQEHQLQLIRFPTTQAQQWLLLLKLTLAMRNFKKQQRQRNAAISQESMQLSMLQYLLHLLQYLRNVDDVQGRIKLIHHDKWCRSMPVTLIE